MRLALFSVAQVTGIARNQAVNSKTMNVKKGLPLPESTILLGSRKTTAFLTLVNDQIDAQFFYFIIRLLQSSTCFEQRRAHHQEVELY